MENKKNGIMRYIRDHPPSHYTLKVKTFSLLVKSETEKHESGVFEVGGYKWKLILYPLGDEKANGKDHISLSMAIEDTSSFPHGWEVNVEFKLFVFDQLNKKYLTIQDANEPIKCFNESQTEWGFGELLPLESFLDENNGYLVNDCCAFGAEIFLIQPTGKWECLSIIEEPDNGTFSSKLENLSNMQLTVGEKNWNVTAHDQRGYKTSKGRLLSAEEAIYPDDELSELDVQRPGISKFFRDLPPAHYLFEIKSFSSLRKSEVEKHESDIFEAGGFQWRLTLLPNGWKKTEDDGHISLYLKIVETETLPLNWEVYVNFSLFVFNQKSDKYLVVQDAVGIVRRFHEMKTEWGFDDFLPLNIFNDPSKGYLVNNCCTFGAEILVIKPMCRKDFLSLVNEPANHTYTWKIQDFSKLSDEFVDSKAFNMGGRKWKLRFYPKGTILSSKDFLVVSLRLEDWKSLPLKQEWEALVRFRIMNQLVSGSSLTIENRSVYTSSKIDSGLFNLIALASLRDTQRGYSPNDIVILEVSFVSLTVRF